MGISMFARSIIAFSIISFGISAYASNDMPQINASLQNALNNSEALQAEIENIKSVKEEINIARTSMEWSASLSSYINRGERSVNGNGYFDTENENLSLTIKKPIYDGGEAKADIVLAKLKLDDAILSYRTVEQNVLEGALTAHVNLVTARQRLQVEQTNVERLKQQVSASELRVQLGDSTPTQLALTQSRLARAEASLISAETQLSITQATYNRYFGQIPDRILLPEISDNMPLSAGLAGDIALDYYPSHQQVIVGERLTRFGMDTLIAQIRPQVDFSITGSTTNSNLATSNVDSISAAITLTAPLFPTQAVRSKSKALVADHKSMMLKLSDSEQLTRLNAENTFRQFIAVKSLITANKSERDAAIIFRNGVRKEVEFGLKTLLDLLDAEQDVVNAELSLISTRGDYVLSAYALLASIGKLNAEEFDLMPIFLSVDDLPRYDLPFNGIPPKIIYQD